MLPPEVEARQFGEVTSGSGAASSDSHSVSDLSITSAGAPMRTMGSRSAAGIVAEMTKGTAPTFQVATTASTSSTELGSWSTTSDPTRTPRPA
ncbi:hypothetical protein GCM10027265_38010 [Jatrophihabitans fulvus]